MSDEVAVVGPPEETALVEVAPGATLLFGAIPEGVEVISLSLVPAADRDAIANAVAASSSILNLGGQVASGIAQAHGLIRLAPETLAALHAGATPIKSGGYYLGTLAKGNQFSHSVRWLPATGAQTATLIAAVGPALAMMAIQMQLSELSGLVRQNLALTETVLKSIRHEQWAELTGLEQAMSKALEEANRVGQVTPLLWENIAGHEPELRKQRDLFRRHAESHAAELRKHAGHKERRQYIEKNGEAILLDLHSLLLAHKAWFEYQALRAGRARLNADDPAEALLLESIVDNARKEHQLVSEQMSAILDTYTRELRILVELPGKHTVPFSESRKSAKDVARMADQLLHAVEGLSLAGSTQPAELEMPAIHYVDDAEASERDLRILRWHLLSGERLEALATARAGHPGALEGMGGALKGIGAAVVRGVDGNAKAVAEAGRRGMKGLAAEGVRGIDGVLRAMVEPGTELLIAVTDQRVLVSDLDEFRRSGVVGRSLPKEQIRMVRVRDDRSAKRISADVITDDADLSWRFSRGTNGSETVRALADLLSPPAIPQASQVELAE